MVQHALPQIIQPSYSFTDCLHFILQEKKRFVEHLNFQNHMTSNRASTMAVPVEFVKTLPKIRIIKRKMIRREPFSY